MFALPGERVSLAGQGALALALALITSISPRVLAQVPNARPIACKTDWGCPKGQRCDAGACVPKDAPPTASPTAPATLPDDLGTTSSKPAAPTTGARAAASRDFSMCREMQKEGSATACWKVWLKKHRATGSEAEVAYAEEHTNEAAALAASTKPTAPAQPGADKAAEPKGFGTSAPEGGSDKPSAQPIPLPASDRAVEVSGAVLDLCGLKPKADATRFVKQRVIVFAPAQSNRIESEQAIRSIGGGAEVRSVFASRFPLDRFHNVITTVEAKPGWATAERVSLDELRLHIDAAAVPPPKDGDASTDAADAKREKEFVRYSLGCADFIALPDLTDHKAEWEEREVKTKKGTKKVRTLNLKLEGSMGIFRREGDAYVKVETVSASVPSFVDIATDATAGSIPDIDPSQILDAGKAVKTATKVLKLPDYISAIPDAACVLKREVSDGVPTLGNCKEKAIVRPIFAAASIDERASDTCKKANADGTPSGEAARLMAICEVRVRAFQLSRALQKEARGVEGWKLFAPLEKGTKDDSDAWAFSLGKDEGVKTGWGFYAVDANRERLAYFKAGDIGPGGDAGLKERTELIKRFGDAPLGARVEEYPQIGIKITPWGGLGLVTWNYGASVDGRAVWRMPSLVVGGGGTVSYDLSSLLGWNEFSVNVGAGYLAGLSGENVQLGLLPIDVGFEKGWSYRILTFYLAIGQTTTVTSVKVKATPDGGTDQSLGAVVVGAHGRLGFDFMMAPWASLRLEGIARVHFNKADYKDSDDDKNPVLNGFDRRVDHFANLGPNVALAFTF